MKHLRWIWSSTLVVGIAAGAGCKEMEDADTAGTTSEAIAMQGAGFTRTPKRGVPNESGAAQSPEKGEAEAVAAPSNASTLYAPCIPSRNPTLLSQTCLFSNIRQKIVDPGSLPFEPVYKLWSDGAEKRRWIRLPAGSTIDTSDMDHWEFPVGTRVFKEFALGGKLLETRMIERVGTGTSARDYRLVTFIWKSDASDAVLNTTGARNVLGTEHDVPSQHDCAACHDGEAGRVLGFSALQLSKSTTGLTLTELTSQGRLSVNPPAGTTYSAPGTPTEAAALGYLHANCGHCHNPNGLAARSVDMVLRLGVAETSAETTEIHTTTVGVSTQAFLTRTRNPKRVVAGDPAHSELYVRMTSRGFIPYGMPLLGSEKVDPTGAAAVAAWINGL